MSELDCEESTEDPACPYCDSTINCGHLLLVIDETFRAADGGLLAEAFDRRLGAELSEDSEEEESDENFDELVSEVEELADAEKRHVVDIPRMSSSYRTFYASSQSKAEMTLRNFSSAGRAKRPSAGRMEWKENVVKKLLYRVVPHNGGVVFAEPERAARIAQIHGAIATAKTWGEFRSLMPRADYSEVVQAIDAADERRPKSSDSFSGEDIPGWSDGDYPAWLQPEMDWLLPPAILSRFGKRESTWVNGSYWSIPAEGLPAICKELNDSGWTLELAQHLQFH